MRTVGVDTGQEEVCPSDGVATRSRLTLAFVDDLVTVRAQALGDIPLQLKPGVVGSDGNAHGDLS